MDNADGRPDGEEKVGEKRATRSDPEVFLLEEASVRTASRARARVGGDEDEGNEEESFEQQPSLPSAVATILRDHLGDDEEESGQGGDVSEGGDEEGDVAGVAAILRDHLLSKVSEENIRLIDENEKLKALRACLATVKITLGKDNDVIVADLSDSHAVVLVEKEGTEEGKVMAVPFRLIDPGKIAGKQITVCLTHDPVPLSDLKDIKAIQAHQQVGEFADVYRDVTVEDDGISAMILLAEHIAVRVMIAGLGDDDVERFRDGAFGSDQIREYLLTGTGLQAEDAKVTLAGLDMFVTPEIKSVMDILAPICMCPNHPDNSSLLNAKQTDYEKLRRKIIASIGGNGAQTKRVLQEGKSLQIENICLKAMRKTLGTMEVGFGALTLSLEDGHVQCTCDNELVWVVENSARENFSLQPDDIHHHSASLSGTPLFVSTVETNRAHEDSTMRVRLTYHNGVVVFGRCNRSDIIDTPVTLNVFVFPLSLVKDTLDVLGTKIGVIMEE